MVRPSVFLILALAALAGCRSPAEDAEPPSAAGGAPPAAERPEEPAALFVESAAATGLDFVHFNGMSGKDYLAEITCGGGALFDYDGDGDLDVYLAQGHMLGPGREIADALLAPRHPLPLTDRLYRNDLERGALAFTDVTAEAGLEVTRGYGCGAATGDVDGDGRTDLLVLNLGSNQLLRNGADGVFRDVTEAADPDGALRQERTSVAAAFFDYDRDGALDLFVANNLYFEYVDPPQCYDPTGARDYCGPGAYPPEPDQLLRNRLSRPGVVAFEDVTAQAGLGRAVGPALGAVAADFDGDGWLDVYVANDGKPNNLWLNQGGRGSATFVDEAVLAGCSVNARGESEASMGVDADDVDRDGDLDLFMTHLIRETNTLYLNDGQGLFADATTGSGLGPASLAFTSFGTKFFDYDNDGWLDLLVVNGAVTKLRTLVAQGDPFPLHQTNQLFRNLGAGDGVRFAEVTAEAGEAFALSEVSRGALFGDLDNDGDTDVVVVNNAGPVRLLVNQVGHRRAWLGLRLVAGEPPRDDLGARAALVRGEREVRWRWVRANGSYNAASDPRLLFGLGEGAAHDGVRVYWGDGSVEEWPAADVPAGRYTTLVRGTGARAP